MEENLWHFASHECRKNYSKTSWHKRNVNFHRYQPNQKKKRIIKMFRDQIVQIKSIQLKMFVNERSYINFHAMI